jgi:uridine phosphorylase
MFYTSIFLCRSIQASPSTASSPDHLTKRMDNRSLRVLPPILRNKHHGVPSAFTPESLLREARRQRGIPNVAVPEICILDPDGDIVRHLRAAGRARPAARWACYHSAMDCFVEGGREYGIVGCVVGAPFAVLVAEQLFASGCRLLLSITSSGQVTMLGLPPYFILIERALRDEGTSYHYLPFDPEYAEADPALLEIAESALANIGDPVERGATWTTDAPYRETLEAVGAARAKGILAVEMEAAALYAFAEARRKPVLCFAHVTNRLGQSGDFEKGEANGSTASLTLVRTVAEAYLAAQT